MVPRYRRAGTTERQQIKWGTYASGLAALMWAAVTTGVFGSWSVAVVDIALTGLPIGACIGILKHRLFDIDVLINRTLVYATLTIAVVGLYVVLVGSVGALLHTSSNLIAALLATGFIAVLFEPLRERVQRAVNHLLYGQRDEPYAVLSRLGQRLEASLATDAVLPSIVETVRDALKLPYAALALPEANGMAVAAAAGAPAADVVRLPLTYQHESVGELRLGRPARGDEWSQSDRQVLADLARQAGVAVHAVRLSAELQRSRERLVSAREEERRRLRRDLHDELAARPHPGRARPGRRHRPRSHHPRPDHQCLAARPVRRPARGRRRYPPPCV